MKLEILAYPDPRLRRPAAPVEIFDAGLSGLAQDLLEAMRAAPGIGVSAAHCGLDLRLVVIELPGEEPRFYVNPRILEASVETGRGLEGSVSMKGVSEEVERARRVRVGFQDLSGAPKAEEAEGLLAVCLQHEIDQLDGIFWIFRLSRLKRERALKAYGKAARP